MQRVDLPLFTNLLILLVAARIIGVVFQRFKQPAMIGEVLAGIVLGPSLLNFIHRTEDIKVISELGVFLLVIIAGLEIDIDHILDSLKGRNILISIMAFILPMGGGALVGYYFDQDILSTMFIGLCVAITALPVSIRILMDLGKVKTEVGQKIISVAIFDDVLALTILGVLLSIKDTEMTAAEVINAGSVSLLKLFLFIFILGLVYFQIKKLVRKGNYIQESLDNLVSFLKVKESLFTLFFVFVLLFSTFTETLGLYFIVGAFFASMLISDALIGKHNMKEIENTTSNLAMGFLAPIFFAGIGLEFVVSSIQNVGLLISILAVSYLSKIAGGFIGGTLAGLKSKVSLALGIGLNARGIMELVIANIAFKNELISQEVFSISGDYGYTHYPIYASAPEKGF